MKKILVPYDFTNVSQYALDFACQIAKKWDAYIMLLNVIEHPTSDSFKTMGVQETESPATAVYMKKMIETIEGKLHNVVLEADHADDKINYKIQIGNPFNSIIEQITEEKSDLVIVGTEGSEGLNEFFVGSNAEKIVRKAACPVISLKNPVKAEEIKKLVFASDFQNTDSSLVDKVVALQKFFEAELNIVKINTPASFTSTRHDTRQMEEFVEKFNIENCTIDIYNYKNEEDGIIYFAEDIEADMIALGTHQRRGLGHFLAGSIAEDVVNHASIPVFTAHLDKD